MYEMELSRSSRRESTAVVAALHSGAMGRSQPELLLNTINEFVVHSDRILPL